MLQESISDIGTRTWPDPEVEVCLAVLKNSKETGVAGSEGRTVKLTELRTMQVQLTQTPGAIAKTLSFILTELEGFDCIGGF